MRLSLIPLLLAAGIQDGCGKTAAPTAEIPPPPPPAQNVIYNTLALAYDYYGPYSILWVKDKATERQWVFIKTGDMLTPLVDTNRFK